ncbi:hypothetical protein BO86DRAFT_395398 [Aspergillus japonicus CBS 114.51]|uniref:Uncharacterized protein n=1 Tax=Aspergillus japonicus CBS 114.51 TaxID=1448312 RepID=A0A8T8XD46_ASPJA|nr:hypothetical protein BO86DRAFT_395398 [Aspergillus japonicus CBS 114.51]RAH85950.1 hypothetical protein BO86DRAFT_395398 [Aspergillus japonicus CBS 114.51]
MHSSANSDEHPRPCTDHEIIVPADAIQRPERLDYSRPPATRPYTTTTERIAPGTWLITIRWDPSLLGLQAGEHIRVHEDICKVALARAFKELWVRFPTCKLVYGCIDVYSTVALYSSEQQPLTSSQDGAVALTPWRFPASAAVDGDDNNDSNAPAKLLAEWKSAVPRNAYDAKEAAWCDSHRPKGKGVIPLGRPLPSSVSRADGPDGYSPLLVLGSCSLCGMDHEPCPGDSSQAAWATVNKP